MTSPCFKPPQASNEARTFFWRGEKSHLRLNCRVQLLLRIKKVLENAFQGLNPIKKRDFCQFFAQLFAQLELN